ncbi:helix-turn-helix domain-containing protein [Nocardia sp. NPDC052278]|uniref:helix-turn-helix domain-containing protein n=1 Tax=unclassified Nocardia TaxID=2637762 RepID=UPI0036B358D1
MSSTDSHPAATAPDAAITVPARPAAGIGASSGQSVAPSLGRRPDLELPTLGRYLRRIRDHDNDHLSREKASVKIGISAAYLVQIENGARVPTPEMVKQLATGYRLSAAQTKHLLELRAPSADVPAVETMRAHIHRTPSVLERLDDLNSAGMVAAYFGPLWHVLAANDSMRQVFPGIHEAGNLLVWHFLPIAKDVLVDWEREATLMVQILKATLGRHRKATLARRLLSRLQRDDDFYRMWTTSTHISYRRAPGVHLHIRTADNTLASLSIETSIVADAQTYIRLYQAVRKPYSRG